MAIAVEERTVAGAPLLLAAPAHAEGPLPLVLWYHGFGASKEAHRAELERVAACGFLAAGVDAVGHGARRWPDWDARLDAARAGPPGSVFRLMLGVAADTAGEAPALVDALAAEGRADAGRASLVGISLAATSPTAPRAARRSARSSRCSAPRSGPATTRRPRRSSAPRSCPSRPSATRACRRTARGRLHAALDRAHADPSRARYVELAGAEHLVSGEQWARAMDETVAWLARHG
jgi:hypothetical protein